MNRLDSINFLRDLDPEALTFIDDRLQEVTVPVGGHIVKAGDHAYRFFVIFEGTAIVSQDGQVIASLGPGEVFGEMALLEDLRRNADVVAATNMRLGVLMSWDFREAAQTYPSFESRIDELVVRRSVD
ncbi:MAG TPA: cyclic nucleotide-binding domain-containing protein [Acidimicrobiia bacterium]|nr:cyclic nucleotide-binding domain-containing protein [Acidimicrobiia bacterium]